MEKLLLAGLPAPPLLCGIFYGLPIRCVYLGLFTCKQEHIAGPDFRDVWLMWNYSYAVLSEKFDAQGNVRPCIILQEALLSQCP